MRFGGREDRPRAPSARSRLIAVQAIVVGALLAVAFLVFLRPEDRSPLFEIEAPSTEPQRPGGAASAAGARDGDRGEGRDEARRAYSRAAAGAAPPGGREGQTPPATQPDVAGQAPARGLGAGAAAQGPSGDQYADQVSRLEAKLN